VELHCHSAYSFLDGASAPEELARRAAELGYPALALTDHDGVWGAMEFAQACKEFGVRPIVGCELTVTDNARKFHLTLLVENVTGWRNLCRLITEAHGGTRPRPDVEPLPPVLSLASLEQRAEGLVCLSGCAREGALSGAFERAGGRPSAAEAQAAEALGRRLARAFGRDRFRVELQRPFWRHDRARNRWLEGLAERLGVECVASGDVHLHDLSRAPLQDTLVAVRLRGTLEETEPKRRGNASAHLPAPAAMAARFADHPGAVAESARIAERLGFDLTRDLGYRYPGSEDPDADLALAEICRARLDHRYTNGRERRRARLQRQLDRLLPDRALARRPGAQRAVPGALLERGDHRGARHRSRLSARHSREADPPCPSALRRRALGAGGGVRLLPVARRHPRFRQGTRPAGG
jgi:error-prone DNA polymerase